MIAPASPAPVRRPAAYSAADFAHSPRVVFYEVTQACDLACLHCRARAQSLRHPRELNTFTARLLLRQLGEFPRPPLVVLTGGDPMKRPDLVELVRYGARRDLEMALTPSATPLVTRGALVGLAQAGLKRVALSLDGVDAATHDRFRGVPESFARTLEIVEGVHAAGLSLQINTTLYPANFPQLDRLAQLAADLGAVLWSVFFLVPVGRAADQPRLTAEQYEQAFALLATHARRQPYLLKTTEAPHFRRFVVERDGQLGAGGLAPLAVNDGKGVLFVSHTGLVYPSGFLPLVCGVFPDESLVDVYQHSPILRELRNPNALRGKCRVCSYRALCGGSRARAFAVTGDHLAAEPDCNYLPPGW